MAHLQNNLFSRAAMRAGLAAVFALGAGVDGSIAQSVVVSGGTFAGGISRLEPSPTYRPGQMVAPGSLWFWTKIQVDKGGLAELRGKKALPLQHRWYRSYGGIPAPDERPDFFRNLEEIDDAKMAALSAEAAAQGFFTYRTASCRQQIPSGSWTVVVTDANGVPIACKDHTICRFTVRVGGAGAKTENKCLGS